MVLTSGPIYNYMINSCKCDTTVTPVNPTKITPTLDRSVYCNVWDLHIYIEILHSWKYWNKLHTFTKHTLNKTYCMICLKTKTIRYQETSRNLMAIYSNWLFQSNELDAEPNLYLGNDPWFFNQPCTSWWFRPIWKILVKLDHFPK